MILILPRGIYFVLFIVTDIAISKMPLFAMIALEKDLTNLKTIS